MESTVTASLVIKGQFPTAQFCDWIAHRATLLSLSGWVTEPRQGVLEICVRGDKILIDALETACSLGPIDAHIESIIVQQSDSDQLAEGFYIR